MIDQGLSGYSLPLSPSGRSSMLTPPPWHFSGDILMVDYRVNPEAAAAFLPPGLSPGSDPGAAAAVFAQWQWTSADGAELADPQRAQFGEFLLLLACEFRGEQLARCPYAWVDRSVPLVRGWLQGMPKQFGEIHQTRPASVGRAGPRISPGGRLAGSLSVLGRRVAEAAVTLRAEAAEPPRLHTVPLAHNRVIPPWLPDEKPVSELVASVVDGVEFSPVWSGDAELTLFDDLPADLADLRALAPISVGQGHYFSYAETLHGGRALES
ncbi:acetoacetate decarboxylase [Lentzea pudingi]|uniref:Acetoacetate decarboxylase n=1 Tax=Lentzea pudingi TaxID=1789439 RepID=A0ABQ2IBS7_9PSEU|nr:enduracididine biosynthesis enzyme MppR [Lentzea pudingi]GGN03879.1 acetoacetate decarboxylase [Lentzea pudingi]